jgi:hypothetical protein
MDREKAQDWLNSYHPICDYGDKLRHLVTPQWEGQGCRLCPLYKDGHCHSERALEVNKITLEALSAIENCEQPSSLKAAVKNNSSNQRAAKVWRRSLADPAGLLSWASDLAEQKLVLLEPVCFMEGPLCRVEVVKVSEYAAERLETIYYCRGWLEEGSGWGIFTHDWWTAREKEAMTALTNFREAFIKQERLNAN